MVKVRVECIESIRDAAWDWLYGRGIGESHLLSLVEREQVRNAAIRLGHDIAYWQNVHAHRAH